MAVRLVEVIAKREGSKLTTISQREIGIREDKGFDMKSLCKLFIEIMIREGYIEDPLDEFFP